ncbi:MAG: thioredoxin family protein [Acidobacteriota bacterium]
MHRRLVRRRRVLAAACCAALFAIPVPLAGGLSLGDAPPLADVKMRSVDGREVSLADVRGEKGTLVIFTCNECPYVKGWESRTVALANRALERGIGVIAVNSNDPGKSRGDGFEQMQERARRTGMRYPYVVDEGSRLARAFGATRTPEVFLFDAEGRLVYHGTIDDNVKDPEAVREHFLADAIEAVVEGRPVPRAETKALGCSIKFAS